MYDAVLTKDNFKKLYDRVTELEDMLAKLKRSYEDAINNIDDDNMSHSWTVQKDNMLSKITQTADKIETLVTKDNLESSLTQTAEQIRTEVKNTTDGLSSSITETSTAISTEVKNRKDADTELSSSITETATAIESTVSKSVIFCDLGTDNLPATPTDYQKGLVYKRTESGVVHYYAYRYNVATGKNSWTDVTKLVTTDSSQGGNGKITTMFQQTTDGFELNGDVTISGLEQVSNNLYIGSKSDVGTSKGIYFNNSDTATSGGTRIVTNNAGIGVQAGLTFAGAEFDFINGPVHINSGAYLKGTINFSDATVTGLNIVAVFG